MLVCPFLRQIHPAAGDPAGQICCTYDEDGGSLLAGWDCNLSQIYLPMRRRRKENDSLKQNVNLCRILIRLCVHICAGPSGQYSSQPGEVPQNHKRTICDLSVADRLALYDHVIGVLNGNRDAPESSGQDDLYVDWVSKLQKGTKFCFSICPHFWCHSESSCWLCYFRIYRQNTLIGLNAAFVCLIMRN